jgi:predicted glycoside hydrolase/deacetylase ChbG (UPF0249 family)
MAELLVCADDFGFGPGVDRAIAELARRGRIGAFSCLTNLPRWQGAGAAVAGLRAAALAGLHLNLTEGAPASRSLVERWPTLPTLPRLIARAHGRRLPLAAIADEIDAQWRAFEQAVGVGPDFVDGHQHVHHLPGVRDLVLARAAAAAIPVRTTGRVAGPGDAFKRWLIERTGGRALARLARRQGVAGNAVLLGAYGFEGDYRARMRAWLAAVPARGALLFCHPGRAPGVGEADALPDPIAPARQREFAYLGSDAFARDLADAGVTLSRRWPVAE